MNPFTLALVFFSLSKAYSSIVLHLPPFIFPTLTGFCLPAVEKQAQSIMLLPLCLRKGDGVLKVICSASFPLQVILCLLPKMLNFGPLVWTFFHMFAQGELIPFQSNTSYKALDVTY